MQSGKTLVAEAPLREWEVIGGGDKGGIVVRTGQDLTTEAASERLATGARVRELALIGERLLYEKLEGSGPPTGWVSLKFQEKALLVEASALRLPSDFKAVPGPKARILALPASPGNGNILKFQTSQLRKTLKDVADWTFIEPPTPWKPTPGSTHPQEVDVDDFVKTISKDQPINQWYYYSYHMKGPSNPYPEDSDVWERVEECCEYIMDFIAKEGPFDVLVSCWSGAAMASMLVERLRKKGEPVPWRLSVFFGQTYIDDARYDFQEASSLPTIYVVGEQELDYPYNISRVKMLYTNLLILKHGEGARLPKDPPNAQQIYDRIRDEVCRHCGLPAKT